MITRLAITLVFAQAVVSECLYGQSSIRSAETVGLPVQTHAAHFDGAESESLDEFHYPKIELVDLPLIAGGGMLESDSIVDFSLACDAAPGECSCEDGGACGTSHELLASRWTPLDRLHDRFDSLDLRRFSVGAKFRQGRTRDKGIGYERVMYAPNVLDTAIQVPHVGLRVQLDNGLQVPDRAEYFWGSDAATTETGVSAQDVSVRLAMGNEKLMALTQYTLRSLDPDVEANTTGMGDMIVGAQAILVDGKRTKLATIFRTYLATGTSTKGLGTGHTSLEHGLLARHCLSPEVYLFGEVKYWVPIGGTSGVSGDVLSTGWGVSSIAAESDVFAFLPTFELRTLSFLFGGQKRPGSNTTESIDGETAVELYPGARFVFDRQSDLGLIEFGCAAGITIADDQWFDTRWVFDLRFSH